MNFKIDVDYSDLTRLNVVVGKLEEYVKEKVDGALDEWGAIVVKHIQDDLLSGQMLKVRSGKLKESVGYSHDNFLEVQVYQDTDEAPHGAILTHGIPHSYPIWAHGRALRVLLATGEELFRRRVTYPGMEQHPFMLKGLEDELPQLRQMITKAIEDAAAEAAAEA